MKKGEEGRGKERSNIKGMKEWRKDKKEEERNGVI